MAIRCHCRCRKCEARRCFPRRLVDYVRVPPCEVCGSRDWRSDRWMNRRDVKAMTCLCSGYWFPHRRGSLYCWHRADGSGRYPGDADFAGRGYE